MKNFDYFFGIKLGHLILRQSDNLSKTLQHSDISAAEGQECALQTVETLISKRYNFDSFWQTVLAEATAAAANVDGPEAKRQRKVPARFETGHAEDSPPATVKDHYKRIYLEAVDHIVNCIRGRFEQEGFQTYRKLQDILLKTCDHQVVDGELLKFLCDFYKDDLKKGDLKPQQLELFSTSTFPCKPSNPDGTTREWTLSDVISYFKAMKRGRLEHLSQSGGGGGKARFNVATPTYATVTCTAYVLL